MRSPNAPPRIFASFAATSMPTSSSNAIGPIGIPKSTMALSIDSMAFPSSRRKPDSFMYGPRMRNAIESIDKAMVDFGMPMGPMALLDEVGIDVAAKVAVILRERFGARVEQSRVVDVLYGDHRLGKKGGKGLYNYENGKRKNPDPAVYKLLGL